MHEETIQKVFDLVVSIWTDITIVQKCEWVTALSDLYHVPVMEIAQRIDMLCPSRRESSAK